MLTPQPHPQCRGLKLGRAIPLPALRALVACYREKLCLKNKGQVQVRGTTGIMLRSCYLYCLGRAPRAQNTVSPIDHGLHKYGTNITVAVKQVDTEHTVFWNVTQCSLLNKCQCLTGTSCFLLQGIKLLCTEEVRYRHKKPEQRVNQWKTITLIMLKKFMKVKWVDKWSQQFPPIALHLPNCTVAIP